MFAQVAGSSYGEPSACLKRQIGGKRQAPCEAHSGSDAPIGMQGSSKNGLTFSA